MREGKRLAGYTVTSQTPVTKRITEDGQASLKNDGQDKRQRRDLSLPKPVNNSQKIKTASG